MSPLWTCMWKEWREQRATLGLLAVALLAGSAAVVGALPARLASDPLVLQGTVAIALLATILSTGSDLLARERSGAGLGLLERLPNGLSRAFRAKLAFLLLSIGAAALYGALVATTAALIRCGELPQRLLEGQAPWVLAALVAVSLWVFAVSAWMPSSALALPATVLMLALLAWPAVLALRGHALFQPTPLQGLLFAGLCLAGAPSSAWAAFVRGSRLGRTRRRAAIAGLSVAALFFAPTWAWAAARYASLEHAPFAIQAAWVGSNGHYAFLDLYRSWGDCTRYTAVVVDLQEGTSRPFGPVGSSAFLGTFPPGLQAPLPMDEARAPLYFRSGLDSSAEEEPVVALDRRSASVLGPEELEAWLSDSVGPQDFGLESEPGYYRVHYAGLGLRLVYKGRLGAGEPLVELLRSPGGEQVVDAEGLPRGETGRPLSDVRVRPGRWLARDARRWVWLDPVSGELGDLGGVEAGDWVGQLLDDGRLLIVSGGTPLILDPDSGRRAPLRVDGGPDFEIRSVHGGTDGLLRSHLPASGATVVVVSGRRGQSLALLDTRLETLHLGPPANGARLSILWSDPPEAIVLEDEERLVRYDLASGTRRRLFHVDDVR